MARNDSKKIYLSYQGQLYTFISYQLQEADGSFYITIQRSGASDKFIKFDSSSRDLERCRIDNGREKRKKISYHSSGCVRYHNTHQHSTYFEPIATITQPNIIAGYIIPLVTKLDIYDGEVLEEDFVINFEESDNKRIQFSFAICPWNFDPPQVPHVAIRYKDIFSLILSVTSPEIDTPPEVVDHFIFFTPSRGRFLEQSIDNNTALIAFHQLLQNTNDAILYSPNKEGVYKIICAVPMRIPPEVDIEFMDNTYRAEVVSRTVSVVRFKVKDRNNQTVKQEVGIHGFALNAEL